MKNNRRLLLVLLVIISIFGIQNVKALDKKVEITDISIKDKSGTITVEEPILSDDTITSNISFNEVNDFVIFNVVIKNNDSDKYKIESIIDNNTNENLKIDYSFNKDYISKGETSTVEMKLTYKNKLVNVDKISLNDLSIKINLVNDNGKSSEIVINPTTGDAVLHYIILLILALAGLIVYIVRKKKIIGIFVIALALILLPLGAIAKDKYELNIKFNDIDVVGEFETYNITINSNNGDPVSTREITYGQPIGELPSSPEKEGYTFDKWIDEKGNEVTKDTIIEGQIEIEAKYTLIEYDISYNLNDGALPSGKSNPSKYTIESNDITLNNPEKEGYTFTGWTGTGIETQTTSVVIEKGNTGTRSYVAHYSANENTPYKVIHKFAKLTSGYDVEEVTEYGTTGNTVPAPRKSRTGFITPTVQNVTIAGDGKASVTYIYERGTYSFSITDRTYIDSESTADGAYPYGTSITIKAVERAGYTFSWSDGNTNYERTFDLEEATSLTPVYEANTNTPYTVKHYKQKLTLDEYELADTQNKSGTTDSTVTPAVNSYTGFISPQTQTVKIDGNGELVVSYYYDRETYSFSITDRTYIDSESTIDGTYPYETSITAKAVERAGYTFKWNDDVTDYNRTIILNGPLSLTPIYTGKTNTPYKVIHKTQDLNLTNYTTKDTDNLTGTTGHEVKPSVKEYEGFTSPSLQTATINGDGSTTIEYLYTRNQYTLTVTHPEFVEEDKTGNYYYEETVTLTAKDRAGYTFAGWSTGEEDKTITITMGASDITEEPLYTTNTDTLYKVIHKYAKITEGYDEVEIEGTGTTGSTIPAQRQPKTGFITPEGQNITITGDGKASVTYIYERETYSFSVTDREYLENGSAANGTYPYQTEISLTAQEREGYSFKWSDDVTNYSRTFNLTETTTLSLIYTPIDYTLTANANEGSIIETEGWTGTGEEATKTITYDGTYGTLPSAERVGYTLIGWNTASEGTGTNIESSTKVSTTSNQTIYAQWLVNSYTITFESNGGSSVDNQTVNYGEKATKPANPTKENFAFAGWYTDDTLTTPFDFENTTIDKTTTIYAKWSSCNGFSTASWNTIVSNLESDSSYYPVGCQRRVGYNNGYFDASYKVRLANTSTPEICNTSGYSQTACGTVIEFVEVIEARQINSNGKNTGGWKESNAAAFLNGTFYDRLESNVKSVIIPTYPIVSGSGIDNNSANITNEDINLNKIYYLSAKEVGFDLDNDNKKNDTRTLDYYETNNTDNDRKKTTVNNIATDWWLRTASSTNDSGYFRVESEGTTDSYNAAGTGGNTPAFRIGRMPEFTVTFNTNGGSTVASQTVSYGSTATRPGANPTKTGFIFDDWYTDDTLTTKYDFTTPITGDTTIYAKYHDGCYNFRTDSWSTISSNIETDPSYYPLGCTKEVELDMDDDNTPESYTVRLSNTSTPEVCNTEGYSQTSCGTVVEFIDIPVSKKMHSNENINTGGWKETEIISYLNGDFYNKLPSDLKSIIIPTYPIVSGSGSGLDSDNITKADKAINKLYLLSGKEVGFHLTYDNKKDMETDTRILDYYFANYNNASRVKTDVSGQPEDWWLRTAASNSDIGFFTVSDSGTSAVDVATGSHGVAPAFRIGIITSSKYTVSFDEDGGTEVSDIEVDAGDSINELPTPTKTDHVFVGWFESVTDENPISEPYTPSGDITLIAKWDKIICKKATSLHEVTCGHTNSSYGCRKAYSQGDVYSYGNIIDSDTLDAGDVFDCNVDGTGYNQRFYYLRTIDDKAALISYTNYEGESGQGNTQSYVYDVALTKLPTTTQWDNLPVTFESDTRAARLLSFDDLRSACATPETETITTANLLTCQFIFENSGFESTNTGRNGLWIAEENEVYRRIHNRDVRLEEKTASSENTVRPVIEVPTSQIEDSYIIKYNPNGGTVSEEYMRVNKGSKLGSVPTPTREGYVFDSWYTSLEFTTKVTENTIPNGYLTYYAKWINDIEEATFEHDSFVMEIGDEDDITIFDSSNFEPVTYESNDTSVVTVDESGHLVAVDEGETTITVTGTKSHHTRTVNVRVVAEITEFVVTFDSQGGSDVTDMIVDKNVALGSLPSPDPTKEDYIFGGWFTNTNYSVQVTVDTVIKSDVTFFAKWIPENAIAEINNTYYEVLQDAFDSEMTGKTTIKLLKDISSLSSTIDLEKTANINKDIVFDLNGHSITSTVQIIKTKATLEIKNGSMTTSSGSASVVDVKDGKLVMNSGTITATGGRQAIYNTGGIIEIGGTAHLIANADGSNTAKRATLHNVSGTLIVTGGIIESNRSSNAYAISINDGTFTLGSEDEMYDKTSPEIISNNYGINSDVNYSVYDGIIKGKTAAVVNESKITGKEVGATKVNEVIGDYNALYYNLESSKYKITLDPNGGTVSPTSISVDVGNQIGTLPIPTRGLYTFDGWWTEVSGGTQITSTYEPTGNIKIFARWHYEASNTPVSFNMTNDVMMYYYNNINTWKTQYTVSGSKTDNSGYTEVLDTTQFETSMRANFDAHNCSYCGTDANQNNCNNPSPGERCELPKGFETGVSDTLKVYEYNESTQEKTLISYTTSDDGIIYNMIPGKTYRWESNSDSSIYGYVKPTAKRRTIYSSARNVRDLGGMEVSFTRNNTTKTGTLKYGKLYRGAQLSGGQPDVDSLTKLGITREVDLRVQIEGTNPVRLPKHDKCDGNCGTLTSDQDIIITNYLIYPDSYSSNYTALRETMKYVMNSVINGDNIYFHCTIGTDRTGTLAYFLEGLLGVSEEDKLEDYELTYFYGLLNRHRFHDYLNSGANINPRFLSMYKTYNTNDKIINWFIEKDTTQEEIDSDMALIQEFRDAMINYD